MTNVYNKFSEKYDLLYFKNITQFQTNMSKQNDDDNEFVDFYPSFGIKRSEKTDLLIFGQAVNGWGSGFSTQEELSFDKIQSSIYASNSFLEEKNHSPLDWVNVQWSNSVYNSYCEDECIRNFYNNKYRTCRSFFWNVTYKLVSDYYGLNRHSRDWAKKLVWSNLYKIAPDGRNPNSNERNLQQEISSELVMLEIEELNPKYCIVLTNQNWWQPFQNFLKPTSFEDINLPSEIVCYEKYKQTQIIVTNRPWCGNSEKFAQQILQLIQMGA